MTSKHVWLAAVVMLAAAWGVAPAQADIHNWVAAEPGANSPDPGLQYYDSSPSASQYGYPCEINGMTVSYDDVTKDFNFSIQTNFGASRNAGTVWRDSYKTGTMAQFAAGDLYINVTRNGVSSLYGLSLQSHTAWANAETDYAYGEHLSTAAGTLYGSALFATGSFEAYVQELNTPSHPVLPEMADAQALPGLAPEPVSKMVWDIGANPLNYYPTLLLEGTALATFTPAAYSVANKEWTGTFQLPEYDIFNPDTVDIWWAMQCGNDAVRVTTTGAEPVPAPSSLLLLCLGSVCTAGFARLRKSK